MDCTTQIEVPVLVIGFNRPNITRECISKLRESKPSKMYLACDGPRLEKEGEERLVNEVRCAMENETDWPCEKHFRFSKKNNGCEVTVSEAVTWVLENEENVVVIEDDVIVPFSFLLFAQDMLERYKDDECVFQISSENTTPMPLPNDEDYCFSMYGHICGWATWKRAWKHFDLYVDDFHETMKTLEDRDYLTDFEKKRFKALCERLIREERNRETEPKHTWDYIWSYIKWRDGGLSIVPRVHLSSNIGVVGLHSRTRTSYHYLPYDEDFEAKRHPSAIKQCLEYDEYHYEKWIKPDPFFLRQCKRVKNYLNRRFIQRFNS